MLNHIIQELITKAIEKQTEKIITKKSQKKDTTRRSNL